MPSEKVNWVRVEDCMRKAAHGSLSETEFVLCSNAYKADPAKYGELSRRIRGEEQEAVRKMWSGG
jgi:hypothetical protein